MRENFRCVTPGKPELGDLLTGAWNRLKAETPAVTAFVKGKNDRIERAAAFRFGHHLQVLLAAAQTSWAAPYDRCVVDMELARISDGYTKFPDLRIPDAVIHCRGQNGPNLLAIEFKVSATKRDRSNDAQKLTELINGDRQYRFGVLITLCLQRARLAMEVTWFEVTPEGTATEQLLI